jgi:hypothetical protein
MFLFSCVLIFLNPTKIYAIVIQLLSIYIKILVLWVVLCFGFFVPWVVRALDRFVTGVVFLDWFLCAVDGLSLGCFVLGSL